MKPHFLGSIESDIRVQCTIAMFPSGAASWEKKLCLTSVVYLSLLCVNVIVYSKIIQSQHLLGVLVEVW